MSQEGHDTTMLKFCANLTMLWNELEFTDRFAAAAKAGFEGVEYLFPYAHDKRRLARITRGIRRHSGIRRSRSALAITDTELRLMAALAIRGLRSRPNSG